MNVHEHTNAKFSERDIAMGAHFPAAPTATTTNPALHQVLAGGVAQTQARDRHDLTRARPRSAIAITRIVRVEGELLRDNLELQDYVNSALEGLIVDYIAPWREQISDFISDAVAGCDAKTVYGLRHCDRRFYRNRPVSAAIKFPAG